MRFRVYFGVLLFAAITSAEFHPVMKEVMIKSPFHAKHLNSRTMNCFPAVDGQFPFMARILMHHARCTGALISPSWVLTTAHCLLVFQGANATVYLGSVDVARPVLMIMTNDTRIHPNYISAGRQNNIGLVNLRHSVIFSETIAPITLPRVSQTYPNFGSGRSATIVGWNVTNINNGEMLLEHLQFGTVLIISNEQCIIHHTFLPNTNLCAVCIGDPPQNVCSSQDHMMFIRDLMDDVDILVGIMQNAYTCDSGIPSVWLRPQHYLDWIYNTTGLPVRP